MEFKKNKVLVITKVGLEIAWYLYAISSVVTLFFLIKDANGPHHNLSIPVLFKGQTLEHYYPTHHVNDADITIQSVYGLAIVAKTDTHHVFAEIQMLVAYILSRFLILSILYNLRKIFSTFYHNEPFDYKNVIRIKIIALYIALFWVIHIIFSLIKHSNFISYHLASKFTYSWDFDIKLIIISAIVYIVAEIFRYGFELKKENEEFV